MLGRNIFQHVCCNQKARETTTMGRGKWLDKHLVASHQNNNENKQTNQNKTHTPSGHSQQEQTEVVKNFHHCTELTDTETDHSSCGSHQNLEDISICSLCLAFFFFFWLVTSCPQSYIIYGPFSNKLLSLKLVSLLSSTSPEASLFGFLPFVHFFSPQKLLLLYITSAKFSMTEFQVQLGERFFIPTLFAQARTKHCLQRELSGGSIALIII